MPEDFMSSHVKVAVADPLDTIARTTWCGVVYQWRRFPQPRSRRDSGLLRSDGKRPDGLTLISWKNGRCVTWDVTVTDTLAQSYLPATSGSSEAGSWSSHTLSYQLPSELWDRSITLVSNFSVTLEGAFLKCLTTSRSAFLFQR